MHSIAGGPTPEDQMLLLGGIGFVLEAESTDPTIDTCISFKRSIPRNDEYTASVRLSVLLQPNK